MYAAVQSSGTLQHAHRTVSATSELPPPPPPPGMSWLVFQLLEHSENDRRSS
jgi:hypothetical protein